MDKNQTSPEFSRKRQLDDGDVDGEPRAKRPRTTQTTFEPAQPTQLTHQNLARFNKMDKKKKPQPSDDSGSTKTTTTSTTSSGFAVKARNNGILEPAYSKPPANLQDLRRRQARSRATASPPESAYNDYVDRVEGAGNEATVVVHTSELLKKYPKGYRQAYNRAFTNLPGDVGFNNGLSAPQPDFVEGLEAEEYRPFPADDCVPGAALYKDEPRSITLPHIAGEWKGPAGDMREARMQSAYDGAAMVHARTQALAYMGKSDPPNHAAITTFTTDGANLYQYAHYAATPSDKDLDALEYHQFPISSTSLTSTYQGHKDGRRSLRNAQDDAKTQSEELRDQLKESWEQQRSKLRPVAEHQPVYQPTPPTSFTHKSSKMHSTPHVSEAEAPLSTPSPTHNSGQKRKAPSSQGSSSGSSHHSKYKCYWKKDATSGRYYHTHSDGIVSWLDEEEDERAYRDYKGKVE